MSPPWWFRNGWWSPWCVLDTLAHKLGLPLPLERTTMRRNWICRKHDAALERHLLKRFSGSPNPLF